MLAKFLTSNTGPLPTQLSGHSRHCNIPGRYWSNSGQRSIVALNASVANDLSATLVHDGNGNWNAARKELLSKSHAIRSCDSFNWDGCSSAAIGTCRGRYFKKRTHHHRRYLHRNPRLLESTQSFCPDRVSGSTEFYTQG